MKIVMVFIFLIVIAACTSGDDIASIEYANVNENIEVLDSIIVDQRLDNNEEKLNQVDENNLKQGTWVTRGYKDRVVRIENFVNDTLHGYWFNWEGMQEEGYYNMGKKDGFFRVFYGNKSDSIVMSINLIGQDIKLWYGLPAADSETAIPHKGFSVLIDSMFVEAPHINGRIWYKGLFVNNTPKGKHEVFNKKGQLVADVNYDDSTILFSKHADQSFIDKTSIVSYQFRIRSK